MTTDTEATARAVHARFTRAYGQRVAQEYDDIIFQYRLPVRPALVQIDDLGARHGCWDPLQRTISLNLKLLREQPWDAVVEILKHETAHQVAHEVFGARDAHGDAFQRACDMLGVAQWARKAAGAIPADIVTCRQQQLTPQEDKLLKRVEKLLALATSSNEHEAVAAMERVREMYARHNLNEMRTKRSGGMAYAALTTRKRKSSAVESMIAAILVEHYFVRAVHCTAFDTRALCDYRVVEIMGRPENVAMAEYVFYFLLRKVDGLWQVHRARAACPGSHRRSYMLGVLAGFRDKLRQAHPVERAAQDAGMSPQQCRALVRQESAELEAYVASRFPRLRTRSGGRARHFAASFAAGEDAGRQITISKAVDGGTRSRGLLLGGKRPS